LGAQQAFMRLSGVSDQGVLDDAFSHVDHGGDAYFTRGTVELHTTQFVGAFPSFYDGRLLLVGWRRLGWRRSLGGKRGGAGEAKGRGGDQPETGVKRHLQESV